jgi:hypothetical protein
VGRVLPLYHPLGLQHLKRLENTGLPTPSPSLHGGYGYDTLTGMKLNFVTTIIPVSVVSPLCKKKEPSE